MEFYGKTQNVIFQLVATVMILGHCSLQDSIFHLYWLYIYIPPPEVSWGGGGGGGGEGDIKFLVHGIGLGVGVTVSFPHDIL